MELESFHEFIELAKRLNFTETARILHMSQPTLSKHISALEKELRISLFDRSGPQLALTSAGQAILPFSYKILGLNLHSKCNASQRTAAHGPR